MVQYDRFDDLIHMRLTSHLVKRVRRGQEGGSEHDGQVPSIHHVLIAVLRKAVGKGNSLIVETFTQEISCNPVAHCVICVWQNNHCLKMCVLLKH